MILCNIVSEFYETRLPVVLSYSLALTVQSVLYLNLNHKYHRKERLSMIFENQNLIKILLFVKKNQPTTIDKIQAENLATYDYLDKAYGAYYISVEERLSYEASLPKNKQIIIGDNGLYLLEKSQKEKHKTIISIVTLIVSILALIATVVLGIFFR